MGSLIKHLGRLAEQEIPYFVAGATSEADGGRDGIDALAPFSCRSSQIPKPVRFNGPHFPILIFSHRLARFVKLFFDLLLPRLDSSRGFLR